MNDIIRRIFGDTITEREYSFPSGAPLYITRGYKASLLVWDDHECILSKPLTDEWTLPSIKKQIKVIEQLCAMPVIIELDQMTALQRTNLIESRMAFVSGSGQLFIPFWACYFEEKIRNAPAAPENMTDNAQLVFTYLCYLNQETKTEVNLVRISKDLKIPKSTLTRAVQQLDSLGLISSRNGGVSKWVTLKSDLEETMRAAENALSSPIRKTVYLKAMPKNIRAKIGGIRALADMSMLAANESDGSFAISREEYRKIPKEGFISRQEFRDFGGVVVEVWRYDPFLLSDDKYVDEISLVLSLKDDPDERIQKELDSIRHKYGIEEE